MEASASQSNVRITPEASRRFVADFQQNADALYEDLRRDAKGTLARYGIDIPDAMAKGDVQLPAPEELERALSGSEVEMSVLPGAPDVFFLHPIMFCIFLLSTTSEH